MSGSNTNFSFSSTSSFSSSTTANGQTTGTSYTNQTLSNPEGTTVQSSHQNLGEAPVMETKSYDAYGKELMGNGDSQQPVIEDVTDADKKYEEAMEDEYAKREGGA